MYKRAGSPYWYIKVGSGNPKSTGTTDKARARELERFEHERVWRGEKLRDISWLKAVEKYLNNDSRPKKREREFLPWIALRIGKDELVSAVADRDVLDQLRADALADGWSRSTCDRMMATVSAVLRHAGCQVKLPMFRPPQPEPRWLTPEEFERLCAELPLHLELAARFAVLTMLRMRSMLGLTWDRVDVDQKRLWIPGAHMKTKAAIGLPLSTEAIEMLRRCRALAPESRHVFTYEGRPYDDCNTPGFKKAIQRAGVGPLRWHDLRHTGASLAVQAGVPLYEVMALGGWRDFRMVQRYAHLAPDHLASAANRIGEQLRKRA